MQEPMRAAESFSTRSVRRRWARRLGLVSLFACIVAFAVAEYLVHNAEPILRRRIVATLSARFHAPVQLDDLRISLWRGIEVQGSGLRIAAAARSDAAPLPPLIAVQQFTFRTGWRQLFERSAEIPMVRLQGMIVHIPPPSQRHSFFGEPELHPSGDVARWRNALVVEDLLCRDVQLYVESDKPGRDPLLFDIRSLTMHRVGARQPMQYDAQLVNPKPRGFIHAVGHFGPWGGISAEGAATASDHVQEPGQTPVDGHFTFDHADLNTIAGIGGTLSSAGAFSGVLDRLVVDGTAEVPNFSLDLSQRPVPLATRYHAVVNGSNGDTYLQPVQARLLGSNFTTSGHVVNVKGRGHDIDLDIAIPQGRMEDFLRLAVKTSPPVLNGALGMQAHLHIPPGPQRVPLKMEMSGRFDVTAVRFNNARWQDRIDGFSARAQGRPHDVAEVSQDREAEVHSRMSAQFTLHHGVLSMSDLRYAIPGATVQMNGVYSTDGRLFEFKGHVRTEATASQMLTGWKSLLVRPLDPFLRKGTAGVQLPVEVSGTQGDIRLGLAMKGADDTPQQLLADMRDKQKADERLRAARVKMTAADAEDRKAAQATSLQAAEQAHRAAVADRAEAKALLAGSAGARDAAH